MEPKQTIDLATPLTLRTAFRFPLQTQQSRREILIGAGLLLLPLVGWLWNMGHRIQLVRQMQAGQPAWPAWHHFRRLLKLGFLTFLGMVEYHAPSAILGYLAWRWNSTALWAAAVVLAILATIAVPGYMTHYCKSDDPREIFDPFRALSRVFQGGRAYWHAWSIALAALAVSFLGLLALGIGFLVSSVWFWQVAGYSFATVFTQRFGLQEDR